MLAQAPNQLGHARLDPADGQRHRQRIRCPSSSRPTPTPRPRARRSALMTTMAATYAPNRIRVNAVAPGLTDTPMAARAADDPAIRAFARASSRSPARCWTRTTSPHAAVYFLSDESRAVTGQRPRDRRRLVGHRGLAEPSGADRRLRRRRPPIPRRGRNPSGDIRPDRARRHRPGRARGHVRPRAPRHRRRAAGRARARLRSVRRRLAMATEVRDAAALGLRCAVDAMPCDAGRNAAQAGRAARGVTGVKDRGPDRAPPRALLRARPLERDDRRGRARRPVRRRHRRGDRRARLRGPGRPAHADPRRRRSRSPAATAGRPTRDRRVFEAAAAAHRRTGAPILTHCEAGTGGARAGPPAGRPRASTRGTSA